MITIENDRWNGACCEPVIQQTSLSEAFQRLAIFELGYGGRIQHVAEDMVVVVTEVMGCIDTITFTGESEEMRPLFCLANCWMQVRGQGWRTVKNMTLNRLDHNPDGGNPRLLEHLLPLLVGESSLLLALVLTFGLTNPEDIKIAARLKLEDFVAAGMLAQEEHVPFGDVVALLALAA